MHTAPPFWVSIEASSFADILRWALVVLGCIYFVTEASIATPVRVRIAVVHPLLEALIYCPACSGFWLGLALCRFWGPLSFSAVIASGVSAMALGAIWTSWRGTPAWANEEELRREARTQAEASDDRAGSQARDEHTERAEPPGDERAARDQ